MDFLTMDPDKVRDLMANRGLRRPDADDRDAHTSRSEPDNAERVTFHPRKGDGLPPTQPGQ